VRSKEAGRELAKSLRGIEEKVRGIEEDFRDVERFFRDVLKIFRMRCRFWLVSRQRNVKGRLKSRDPGIRDSGSGIRERQADRFTAHGSPVHRFTGLRFTASKT
jgi:hypothetical protein